MKRQIFVLIMLMLFCVGLSAEYDFSKITNNISEFTLPNGLKFILLEDHSVPIATFVTYTNTGGSDERIGIYGISHFLEHMAFKGTSEIGTKDYEAEKKVFAKMDDIFDKILVEKAGINPDEQKIKAYYEELEKLKEEATQYVEDNEFDKILNRNGANGINAGTSKDATIYFFSLPSNKLELWAYMESARFADPVFREFYKERGVIQEERRVRSENSPIGKLVEELLALAYKDHPYRINGIGPMSNIDNITRADMIDYFRTNYSAQNLVIGVNGDVTLDQLKKVAEKYFTKIPAGRKNHRILTVEPAQIGEKAITIYEDSQPIIAVCYHIPSSLNEDFIKFSIFDNIITNGRSSRLKKKMEIDDKTSLVTFSFAGFPGSKYPALYLIFSMPTSGHTTDEILKTVDEELEKIKKESVTEEELASAKTRWKVNAVRELKSGQGLLMGLLQAEAVRGSWKKLFDDISVVEKITTDDIRQLAEKYLTTTNRSIARIEKKKEVAK